METLTPGGGTEIPHSQAASCDD
jgi:hypothetical protein